MPFGRIFVLNVCLKFEICSRRHCVNPLDLLLDIFFQNLFYNVINCIFDCFYQTHLTFKLYIGRYKTMEHKAGKIIYYKDPRFFLKI